VNITGGAFIMAGKKGMSHYHLATKLEAVRLHGEEGMTYAEVAE
jgi:hypothetical protein